MEANHSLALEGRDALVEMLEIPAPAPDHMLGSMAAVPLPPGDGPAPVEIDPLQTELLGDGFEVPVVIWPRWPSRLPRISAQEYNSPDQYVRLAQSLAERL